MKIKIFTTSAWNTSSIEADVNRWLERNPDYSVVDIKMAGTEDKVICTVMYNDNEKSMTAEEAMIEAARAGAILTRNNDVPKETPKPSPCGFCSLCPADSNVCPLTGKDINTVPERNPDSPCLFCSHCPTDSNICMISGKDINEVTHCMECDIVGK